MYDAEKTPPDTRTTRLNSPNRLDRSIIIAYLAIGLAAAPTHASAADDDDQDQSPGLVAVYREENSSRTPEVWRIEPVVAFRYQDSESPHPRVDSRQWSAEWQGVIQIFRAARYRFSAELIGDIRVVVGEQAVLTAEADSNRADPVSGPEVDLPAGALPIRVQFRKGPGPARVRLFWQSPSFTREPVPWTVLRHAPGDRPPQLMRSAQQDRGRFLVEELSCAACHIAADDDRLASGLHKRQGPDLSRIGERAFAGWIVRWLDNPQSMRPQAVMPRMFGDDGRGRVERYAVASYLATLGGPPRAFRRDASPEELRNQRRRGERLFGRVGCNVCHSPTGNTIVAELKNLGSKMPPDRLSQYLQNPLSIDPSGRMPSMGLDSNEARDIAQFLCQAVDESISRELPALAEEDADAVRAVVQETAGASEDPARFASLSVEQQLRASGRRLVVQKGCTNCHRIESGDSSLAMRPARTKLGQLGHTDAAHSSCLQPADRPHADGVPRYALSDEHRSSIRSFLENARTGAGATAPTFAAEVALRRYHCTACHARSGFGGLDAERVEDLRRFETAQDAEGIRPPSLTEVGSRLRTSWLRAVLCNGRRARPWMGLRMPQFGPAQVDSLVEQLAACDGVAVSDEIHAVDFNPEHVDAGRKLVGKSGFGCISCHDMAGQPNTGTRGPDMASTNQRVRFEWYTRWLDDPQRMEPGTRMPTVFPNGTTSIKSLLGGDARVQSQAIWEYLSLGANLPLPEGLEPPKGLVLQATQAPMLVRSFLPDAGSRALAIGFPEGVSFAFDTAQCRLAYGWTGRFLDVGPVWQNRGGVPAGIPGTRFWSSPPGCPWDLTESPGNAPDWRGRLGDPARGALLPEGQAFEGRPRLRFRDYAFDKNGAASLRYALESAGDAADRPHLSIREQFQPIQRLAGVGVRRSFELQAEGSVTGWLLAATSKSVPQVLNSHGDAIAQEITEFGEQAAREHTISVKTESGVLLIKALAVPENTRWVFFKVDDDWHVSLRVPISPMADPTRIVLAVLAPYRNDARMVRELLDQSIAP
jgi:cbb3-type cytochrome oxidase cytochrome c subunit